MTTANARLIELYQRGMLQGSAVASVEELFAGDVAGRERRLALAIGGGLSMTVLPDRGLDLGTVLFRGVPISWTSPIPAMANRSTEPSGPWLSHFSGGLLVTCGLRNIGPATSVEPMHGDYTFLRAAGVSWRTEISADSTRVVVDGRIDSIQLFGHSHQVRRRIAMVSDSASDRIEITDSIQNVGPQPAPIAMLYHVNFGAPLVVPGTGIQTRFREAVAREDCPAARDSTVFPSPVDEIAEAVFEHAGGAPRDDGRGWARIVSESHTVTVDWNLDALPRLYQWVLPTRTRWALAIEPSTAPLFGSDRDAGPFHGAPILRPGESRVHDLRIVVEAAS